MFDAVKPSLQSGSLGFLLDSQAPWSVLEGVYSTACSRNCKIRNSLNELRRTRIQKLRPTIATHSSPACLSLQNFQKSENRFLLGLLL